MVCFILSIKREHFKSLQYPKALFIGGGSDHIFPPTLTKKIAGRYQDKRSKVDLKIFEGRSHFTCGEPGWENVADYILDWYESLRPIEKPVSMSEDVTRMQIS